MLITFESIGMIILYLFLFLAFGSLVTSRMKKCKYSFTLSVFVGMLLYYSVFQLLAVPVTLLKQPLSLLSALWGGTAAIVTVVSIILNRKLWYSEAKKLVSLPGKKKLLLCVPVVITVGLAAYVSLRQIYYLDAAYYVGNVTTSVFTNTINRYDPYTGNPLEVFAIRYLFSNYHIQDAVVCQITGIHPLVETKTIMAAVVMIVSNIVVWQICGLFYKEDTGSKVLMFTFASVISLFSVTYYITYSNSSFLLLRTYEGKNVLASILAPGLVLLFGRIVQMPEQRGNWILLFLLSFAGPVLSTSSATLLPVGLSACLLPYMIWKKRAGILVPYICCVLPSVVVFGIYFLSTKGLFYIRAW